MNALRQRLFHEYGYLKDKRITDPNKMEEFIVDDRGDRTNRHTHDAQKQLFSWFCEIIVSVLSETEVQVSLRNAPRSEQLDTWIKSFQKSENFDISSYPHFRVLPSPHSFVPPLGAILIIHPSIGDSPPIHLIPSPPPHHPYPIPSLICPRDSLQSLSTI